MSFQDKNFWMTRATSCALNGEVDGNDTSRTEPKRINQWLMDDVAPELFSNKKQATEEAVSNWPTIGMPQMNVSTWRSNPTFQSASAEHNGHLFGSEVARSINMLVRNVTGSGVGSANFGPKDFNNQHATNSVTGLPLSPTVEDPSGCIDFGGIRNVRINEVSDPRNRVSASTEASYGNSISLGPLCNVDSKNPLTAGSAFNKGIDSNNFYLMGRTISKENAISFPDYNKEDDCILLMGQSFSKGDANFIMTGPSNEKEDNNVISMMPLYNKGCEDFISVDSNYDKARENVPMSQGCDESTENTAISFAGFHDEPEANQSAVVIGGYDTLMTSQSPVRTVGLLEQNDMVQANAVQKVSNPIPSRVKPRAAPKTKEPKTSKKVTVNNFPANVKSLLSTGVFDGVPVKYVSWTREKSLKGTIQGTAYLCGCEKCKFSQAVNAYEFERHANCKTKHPNNHIYFDSGKTIYGVVQELKNTPQEQLFGAIENVTGSPINGKNFAAWKVSYEAAALELARIYGKDDVVAAPSSDKNINM